MSATAPSKPRQVFLIQAGAVLALLLALAAHVQARFIVGIDDQRSRCLPGYRVFLIDRFDRRVYRGNVFAFLSRGMEPYFQAGTTVVKVAAAVPGDSVAISAERVTVNGREEGQGLALATRLGRSERDYAREVVVPEQSLFALGRTADSFDSRYFGWVGREQVLGRAYPLF